MEIPDHQIEVNDFLSYDMNMRFKRLYPYLLRPPGTGIATFAAGTQSTTQFLTQYYGLLYKTKVNTQKQIVRLWEKSLERLSQAKVALIGIPLDTGAAIRRGAAYGPRGVRQALAHLKTYQQWITNGTLIDLGDVYVNPHLLHDEMLNKKQILVCQKAMYKDAHPRLRSQLVVSALSQTKQILQALMHDFPQLKLFVVGGDHSVAWPVTQVLSQRFQHTLGIVQPDAHTDLLSSRLGIPYCYTTWSFHANNLLGKKGRLVQVGIRQSLKPKRYWEKNFGVKQFWAKDIIKSSPSYTIDAIISHLKKNNVKQIYFSNDIDGTDETFALATGTPASKGLTPDFVLGLIAALGQSFELVAADIMEVAPDLAPNQKDRVATCKLAAQYAIACIEQQLS